MPSKLLSQLACKEVKQNGHYDTDHTVFPSTFKKGVNRCGDAADHGERHLLCAFFSIGEGLVVDTSEFLEAIGTDHAPAAACVFVHEGGFFIDFAVAVRAFYHGFALFPSCVELPLHCTANRNRIQ
ncbi:hypothetical protein HMPREF1985_02306 [Mitsuokella sp. oral taxon 131 str. W9106]|nr:hypothetical protein HMPREF1985_02306 [Mitsuokella sp. oral taxon 131 str. W9106]